MTTWTSWRFDLVAVLRQIQTCIVILSKRQQQATAGVSTAEPRDILLATGHSKPRMRIDLRHATLSRAVFIASSGHFNAITDTVTN